MKCEAYVKTSKGWTFCLNEATRRITQEGHCHRNAIDGHSCDDHTRDFVHQGADCSGSTIEPI